MVLRSGGDEISFSSPDCFVLNKNTAIISASYFSSLIRSNGLRSTSSTDTGYWMFNNFILFQVLSYSVHLPPVALAEYAGLRARISFHALERIMHCCHLIAVHGSCRLRLSHEVHAAIFRLSVASRFIHQVYFRGVYFSLDPVPKEGEGGGQE